MNKPEVMYLEVLDKKDSGFVLDGTENSAAPEVLNAPSTLWIPAEGVMAEVKDGIRHDVKVRWINGIECIDPEEQNKRGFKPNRFEDKIIFEKGFATIVREGSTIGLFDYLKSVYYNNDAPNRSKDAKALYRALQVDKIAEGISDNDELVHDAMSIILSLRIKTGDKKVPYKYNEDRINALCEVLQVGGGDSAATKLHALTTIAKTKPDKFMNLVSKFEGVILTELTHALQLNVIKFDGNTCFLGDKVLKALGQGNFNQQAKLEKVSDYLKTKEAQEILTEFRAKLEVAQAQTF